MPLKSLKNKINKIASGEILGETIEERRRKAEETEAKARAKAEMEAAAELKKQEKLKKSRKPKKTKENKEKIEKERKVSKESFFKRKEILHEPEDVEIKEEFEEFGDVEPEIKEDPDKIPVREAIEGYKDVLAILNIKEDLNLEVEFKSSDLDYIEFTPTTPLGFDFDEVTDFISRVKYLINRYESALEQRNKEIVILASEAKKVEKRMIEQNHARELEKIMGGMTEEESLLEENGDLKIEVNSLKAEIANNKANSDYIKKLEEKLRALTAENEMLIKSSISRESQSIDDNIANPTLPSATSKLPSATSKLPPAPSLGLPKESKLPNIKTGLPSLEIYEEKDLNKNNNKSAFKEMNIEIPLYEEDDEFIEKMLKNNQKQERGEIL